MVRRAAGAKLFLFVLSATVTESSESMPVVIPAGPARVVYEYLECLHKCTHTGIRMYTFIRVGCRARTRRGIPCRTVRGWDATRRQGNMRVRRYSHLQLHVAVPAYSQVTHSVRVMQLQLPVLADFCKYPSSRYSQFTRSQICSLLATST